MSDGNTVGNIVGRIVVNRINCAAFSSVNSYLEVMRDMYLTTAMRSLTTAMISCFEYVLAVKRKKSLLQT